MDAYKKVALLVVVLTAIALTIFNFLTPSFEDLEIKHHQATAYTQSLDEIIEYKYPYMGKADNLLNLFFDLPLGDIPLTMRLFPDELTAEVNYEKPLWDIGEEIVYTSILYNSFVAFALIDNLEYIVFNFVGSSYKVSRYNVEALINNLESILLEENFINLQQKLHDYDFVIDSLNNILV